MAIQIDRVKVLTTRREHEPIFDLEREVSELNTNMDSRAAYCLATERNLRNPAAIDYWLMLIHRTRDAARTIQPTA